MSKNYHNTKSDEYGLFVRTSGFKINNVSVQGQINDIIKVRTSFTKFY